VVAQDDNQAEYLEKMVELSKRSGVPLEWISLENAKNLEPHVIANTAILNSPTTGIISAHSLMSFYEAEIQANGADVSLLTNVERVQYLGNSYALDCKDKQSNEITEIRADAVINAAGHGSVAVSNSLLPSDRQLTAYYAKGNYFAYSSSFPKVNRLIYPCPTDHASLGTHLTIDLAGRIRFGPDVEWVESSEDLKANPKNLQAAVKEISTYLKGIDPNHLQADYAGIRPKITSTGSIFQDFVVRKEEGFPGFINLLNIESPGLTASMAIAEYVESLL
jgi:L-2-hydroxyglutarate oxidase LhgO